MTILEDLKTGRLVVVPMDATPEMIAAALKVDWSNEDEEGTAHNVWHAALAASPDHTTALLSLVEGMERERDETARQLSDPLAVHINMVRGTIAKPSIENIRHIYPEIAQGEFEARCALRTAEARALAAEAERDALREALAPFGSGAVVFYENEPDDCVLSLGRWKYQEDGRARFYADVQFTVADVRRARALTEASK